MIVWSITKPTYQKAVFAILIGVGLCGGGLAFTQSYLSNMNVLIGLCLFPFTFFNAGTRRNNIGYAAILVFCLCLALYYGVRIFYFFALAFYFLWLIEWFVGRLNVLILFLIFFMSPFFIQLITILGLPLRLGLSTYAGSLLNLMGTNVKVEGNMMLLDGAMFSVDEACMGLNMIAISMLMGVFVLAYRYRMSGSTLAISSSALFFSIVFALNIITNLIRIILLVYFRIPPENPMHEFIGIVCLVIYVAAPLHFLSGWLVKRYGTQIISIGATEPLRTSFLSPAIFSLVVLCAGGALESRRHFSGIGYADVQYEQVTPKKLNDGIVKLSTKELLIYIKTIPEFFTGEHTPLMCWKGSGYKFSEVAATSVANVSIYKGTLIKEGHILYTAWWYTNGQIITSSQWDWRMRMLKGESRFYLVNVTATNEQALMKSISAMFTTKPLTIKSHD